MIFGGLGWLPDPPKGADETPDWNFGALGLAAPPPAASARHLVWSILDQSAAASCVANAGFQAVRASQIKQGAEQPALGSRLMGYYLARAHHHGTSEDRGTYIRYFFDALNRFGFCSETVWPYDLAKINKMPSTAAIRGAFDQRSPTEYRRIFETGYERVDSIKRAVAAGYLVVFGTDVSKSFQYNEFDASSPLLPPGPGETIAGGHAMVVAEYDGDTFGIVNSWGSTWGDGGWCRFDASYLAWEKTRDLWIVSSAPRFSS